MEQRRVDCVGGIVTDTAGRLLLVRRGHEPAKGCWSVPGGRVEAGETDAEATTREVLEETGLHVVVGELAGSVERDAPGGAVYVIHDYLCTPVDGIDPSVARAADDAEDAGWFTAAQARRLTCSPGLLEALEEWGVLPPHEEPLTPAPPTRTAP
ncbi:MAG TPA: NUDIX domain-containing protein [Nocardioidaceae bacterium]|nr:NUDIX domain-containing protein [Nocardioidaceae bacterium]